MDRDRRKVFAGRVSSTLASGFFAMMVFSAELASQAAGTVTGTVTGAKQEPVTEAHVRVVGRGLAASTRTDGAFEIANVPIGSQTLQITSIGYSPKTIAIVVAEGQTFKASIVLEAFALEPVTVTADADSSPGIRGFMERKARGSGWYFTAEEIDQMQPRQVTDVLRRVPGMQIEVGSGILAGGNPTARTGRNISGAGGPCNMAYYLNGSPLSLTPDLSINHFVAADDLAGVEVYTGSAQIPPEFNSSLHGSRCGVVALWTRTSLDTK